MHHNTFFDDSFPDSYFKSDLNRQNTKKTGFELFTALSLFYSASLLSLLILSTVIKSTLSFSFQQSVSPI
jgi:hypothetical protein